jgi:thiol-disulfide isomerase/thioredoxin
MRTEYLIIGVLLALIACLALLLAGVVYFFAPLGNATESVDRSTTTSIGTTTTTTITESSTTTTRKATSTKPTSISTVHTTSTTTTTTTTLGTMVIQIPDEKIYKNDDVKIEVLSGGNPVPEVTITMDNENYYTTDAQGEVIIYSLTGGNHTIRAGKEGYKNAYINFTVDKTSYAFSSEVRKQKTEQERSRQIAKGKVVLIFYDLPNCVNCMRMKPWVADIVNENRDCISYELLNIYNEGPKEELIGLITDKEITVPTPIIVIQNSDTKYVSTGYRTKAAIKDKIMDAANGVCMIK